MVTISSRTWLVTLHLKLAYFTNVWNPSTHLTNCAQTMQEKWLVVSTDCTKSFLDVCYA